MKSYTSLVKESISVSLVKEFAYCPMIPWIIKYLDYHPEATPSMETGKSKASPEAKKNIARKLGLPEPYLIEYPVEYKPLKIRGIVDVIAGGKKLHVLEIKIYKRSRKWINHFIVQLLTYAYLVEKTLGPVQSAILYNGGDIVEIKPTAQYYNRIERIVKNLSAILSSEEPPKTRQNPRKCNYCEYRRLCPNYY